MPVKKDLFDEFYDDLDEISRKLFDNVKKMGGAIEGFSDTQIIRMARELDFFIELQEAGFNTSFSKLMEGYDREAESILKDFQQVIRARTGGKATEILLSPANTEAIAQQLQLLRDLDGEVLLGRFAQETATLKSGLLKGIISGEPSGVVAERLSLEFSEQLLSDRSRMIARYVGSKDKKNRPACRYFIDNQQNKKGFTAKDIKDLSKKMAQGKIPLPVWDNKKKKYSLKYEKAVFDQVKAGGHNCRHSFRAVGTRAKV